MARVARTRMNDIGICPCYTGHAAALRLPIRFGRICPDTPRFAAEVDSKVTDAAFVPVFRKSLTQTCRLCGPRTKLVHKGLYTSVMRTGYTEDTHLWVRAVTVPSEATPYAIRPMSHHILTFMPDARAAQTSMPHRRRQLVAGVFLALSGFSVAAMMATFKLTQDVLSLPQTIFLRTLGGIILTVPPFCRCARRIAAGGQAWTLYGPNCAGHCRFDLLALLDRAHNACAGQRAVLFQKHLFALAGRRLFVRTLHAAQSPRNRDWICRDPSGSGSARERGCELAFGSRWALGGLFGRRAHSCGQTAFNHRTHNSHDALSPCGRDPLLS